MKRFSRLTALVISTIMFIGSFAVMTAASTADEDFMPTSIKSYVESLG